MNPRRVMPLAVVMLLLVGRTVAQEGSGPDAPSSVVAILTAHDRALIADMKAYIVAKPEAEDVEQAYMLLFEKAIENDWFQDAESVARTYLADRPDGAVAPLARIVSTMARADAGKFEEALADYGKLMAGLGEPDQEEFAANFADSLAQKAITAGKVEVGAADL